jgi:hypothetical protein
MRSFAVLAIVLSLAVVGCGDDSTPTEPGPQGPGAFSETFAGTLKTSGTAFYSFGAAGGTVQITFASLTDKATGALVAATPQIGLGIPAGTGCGLSTSVNAAPALVSQIVSTLAPGTYCVSIADTGGITADSDFAIRITQGVLALNSTTSPEAFNSNLAPNGTSTRTFSVAGGLASGPATVRLESVSPTAVIGFGIGLWRFDNNTCSLTQVISSSGGAEIALPVDQGTYCVKAFDTGALTGFVAFAATLIHP